MADKDRLQREIEYYTALIQGHMTTKPAVVKPYHKDKNCESKIIKSNRYSLVRNNEKARPAVVHRTVVPSRTTVIPPSVQKISSRTVVKPGSGNSKRTVLKPSKPVPHSAISNLTLTNPTLSLTRSSKAGQTVCSASNVLTNSKQVVQPITYQTKQNIAQHSDRNKSVVKPPGSQQVADTKPSGSRQFTGTKPPDNLQVTDAKPYGSKRVKEPKPSSSKHVKEPKPYGSQQIPETKSSASRFVWVNKTILQSGRLPEISTTSQPSISKGYVLAIKSVQNCSPKYVTKSRYKLTKSATSTESMKSAKAHNLQAVGKYKLVSRTSPAGVKLTMRIKGGSYRSPYFGGHTSRLSPHISTSGKRIISRYKIRKRTINNKISSSASPALKRASKNSSPYKVDRRKSTTLRSRYKIDKLKGTRKPVKYLTKARKADRKSCRWVKQELKGSYRPTFVSPFKLLRRSSIATAERGAARCSTADKNWVVRQIASRSLQKSAAVSVRAKYKKNNTNSKHCMFYMRFGRCKRGAQCYYIHDPDRIAVCTRYLRGTCTIESCPFSHEAKKEKVPVCQHFLRGCCVRDNCPYLHVNVGRNAPICKSFAEFKYCHLAEKCKKLHTDICPNRDSDGGCPKGSKCRLRHPKKVMKRLHKPKVTAAQEDPSGSSPQLSEVAGEEISVPHGEKLTKALPAFISLPSFSTAQTSSTKEQKKLKTKPDFL